LPYGGKGGALSRFLAVILEALFYHAHYNVVEARGVLPGNPVNFIYQVPAGLVSVPLRAAGNKNFFLYLNY